MRIHVCLALAALLLTACASEMTAGGRPAVAATTSTPRSTAQLLNTDWKLTLLGEQVISTPQDKREIHFVMHAENPRVTGFSGCNQMMGSYVLEGANLRFAQMAGTMMACVPDMELERKFLAMFAQVAHWEIIGETLRLLDADGKTLATFASRNSE